jgi:hypothetical protein
MSWTYGCPKCKAMLNPHDTIILTAARGELRTLIGLHPEPGNYQIYLPPNVKLEEGEMFEFLCPVCHANLKTAENENLIGIEILGQDKPRLVLFSRIFGERATLVVAGSSVETEHGEHADRYRGQLVSIRY